MLVTPGSQNVIVILMENFYDILCNIVGDKIERTMGIRNYLVSVSVSLESENGAEEFNVSSVLEESQKWGCNLFQMQEKALLL